MRIIVIVTAMLVVLAGHAQAQKRVCTPSRKAFAQRLVTAANEDQVRVRADAQYGTVQVSSLLWRMADLDRIADSGSSSGRLAELRSQPVAWTG